MKTIGILIGNNQSEYIKSLMDEFESQSKKLGIRLIFLSGYKVPSEYNEEDEFDDWMADYKFSSIFEYAGNTGCDACIICYGPISGIEGAPSMEEIINMCGDIPKMLLEIKPDNSNESDVPYIIADGYNSTYAMVKHLVEEHGFSRVAFLAGPQDNYSSRERLSAYKDVMAKNNIEVTDDMVEYGDYTTRVKPLAEKLLDNNKDLEAICCANDSMARACYNVCASRGLKVGQDIAITGFDNSDISSRLRPALTTINHDSRVIVSKALDMALKLAEGSRVENVECECELQIRKSCGCNSRIGVDDINLSHNSEIFAHENISDYNISAQELNDVAISLAKENERLKERLWDVSFFVRGFMVRHIKTDEYFDFLFSMLRKEGLSNAYFFVHKTDLIYDNNGSDDTNRHMYYAGGFDEEGNIIIPVKEWHHYQISHKKGFNDYLPADGEGNFHTYVLFAGKAQYGVMLTRADIVDNEFLLYISIQISSLLHIYNLKTREEVVVEEMERSIERVKESNQILSAISRYDDLTKILNRRGFMEQALAAIHRSPGREAIIMFGDLDHLKEINDCFGHGDGDFAINSAAKLLTGLMPREGFVARIGGDEFVAFIPVPRDQDAKEYIKTLKDNLKEAMFLFNLTCDKPYFVEISSGFHSFVCEPDIDLAKLIANSDEVLYEDKQQRRESIKKG